MSAIRRLAIATGLVLGALLVLPALAPLPAAFVDEGPGRALRPTVFPFGLSVFDPFVRLATRNSLKAAALVTAGSLVLGVGLARVSSAWRFWGRPPLSALVMALMVVPPWTGALGLRWWLGPQVDGMSGSTLAWLGWIWVELACGVPLVALATASAMARVEPATIDAARLAGASRPRIWWQLVWPAVRSDALRGARTVFALTLLDPGAPVVLGLRRTLAFQVVEAVSDRAPFPRAAVLALEALGLALAGNLLLRWMAGTPRGVRPERPIARAETASGLRASAFVVLLGAVAVLGWLPTSALVLASWTAQGNAPDATRAGGSRFWRAFDHPDVSRALAASIAMALAVVAIDVLVARSVAAWNRRRGTARVLTAWLEAIPPLAVGVGGLALVWLMPLAAAWLGVWGGPRVLAQGVRALAGWLDPAQSPGVLLVAAIAVVRLPAMVRAAELARQRFRRVLIDSALTLGASGRGAYRPAKAGWFGVSSRVLVLSFVLAATNLAPALVLEPTIESRTAGPAILDLADQPGDAQSRAAVLASAVVLLNVSALALAARGGPDSLGEWFRGAS